MKNFKLSLVAVPVMMALTACGGTDSPDEDKIPVEIDSTYAEVAVSAIKGTFVGANVNVEMVNGTPISLTEAANTDSYGDTLAPVVTEPGFGIDSITKITAVAADDTSMICDALVCGDATQGGEVSGEQLTGTQLSTLGFLSVPYGNGADGEVDLTVQVNALTTLGTRLIERDIAAGRNVTSQQLLEIAQAEYSQIVTRALGLDTKANIFTTNVVSADSAANFILGEECTDVEKTDDDGNKYTEEVCVDVPASKEESQLSFLNASLSHFVSADDVVVPAEDPVEGEEPAPVLPPVTQAQALDRAFENLVLAIDGDPVALEALRAPVVATLTDNAVLAEVGYALEDVFDERLPIFAPELAGGPVHEITTADNVAEAEITWRDAIGDAESGDKVFDGDLTTKWLDHNGWSGGPPTEEDPSWVEIKFAEPQAVNTIVMTSGNDAPARDPENFDLMGSNDNGKTWVKVASFVGESFDERLETKSFKFSNGLKYQTYRLNITKNKGDNYMQITEVEFVGPIYTSVDHTDEVNFTVDARNRIADAESEDKAFDNDATTKWLDHNDWAGEPTVEDPSWIEVDFATPVAVDTLALTSGGDAPERDPENFELVGSNDNGTTWTTVGSWVGEAFDERVERKLFAAKNQLAFSKYRLNITKNKGNQSLNQLTEIELIGPELAGRNNSATAGIAIEERAAISPGEAGAMAFDSNVETKWLDNAGVPTEEEPSWVIATLPEAAAVNTIAMISANDAPNRDPENFNIEGSVDGETWIRLASFVGESFDERYERKLFNFTNGLAFTDYRVNITKNKGDDTLMQVAEIELIGPQYELVNHGMENAVEITSSGYIGDNEIHDKAFDGNPDTKWLDPNDWAGAPSEEEPFWVRVDLDTRQIVSTLALTSGNDAPNSDPENFTLYGSNDNGDTWTKVNSWVGETFDARQERKVFDFGNGFAYASYKLDITKNKGNDTLMQISEIELIGPQK